MSVAIIAEGAAVISVVRGESTGRFVVWTGETYSGKTADMATRAKADAIWQFIVDNYDIVYDGTYAYNGLDNYNSEWPNCGRIGGET